MALDDGDTLTFTDRVTVPDPTPGSEGNYVLLAAPGTYTKGELRARLFRIGYGQRRLAWQGDRFDSPNDRASAVWLPDTTMGDPIGREQATATAEHRSTDDGLLANVLASLSPAPDGLLAAHEEAKARQQVAEAMPAAPAKRGRGRPRGSKNKSRTPAPAGEDGAG